MEKGNYVVVRSGQAGVFAGEFVEKNGTEVILKNARKIYRWDGAYTVEDIAVKGLANIDCCQITIVVPEIVIDDVCQVLPTSEVARGILEGTPVWTY